MNPRVVRVFVSSTFRDFAIERDLLTTRVFPELRRRCRDRFVEVIGVDLRWGITEEDSQNGRTIAICLREIDRSRPYFIGLLGQRYGWVPSADEYPATVIEKHPWLAEHTGRKSVTELEILHGVLNEDERPSRAAFFRRDSAWATVAETEEFGQDGDEGTMIAVLHDRLRARGCLITDYDSPEAVASLVTEQVWAWIDADHPAFSTPDEVARESSSQEAFAARTRDAFSSRTETVEVLRRRLTPGEPTDGGRFLLLGGEEGTGKTTLVTEAVGLYRADRPSDAVFEHYVGSSRDSGDAPLLLRRLGAFCLGHDIVETKYAELCRAVPDWMASLAGRLRDDGTRALVVLEGLDRLDGADHVPWLPEWIPPSITVLASASDGPVADALRKQADDAVQCEELPPEERQVILESLLTKQGKRLDATSMTRIVAHPSAGVPAFLVAVVHDLCLSAVYQNVEERVDEILSVDGINGLHARTLSRAEADVGVEAVRAVSMALTTSRGGLTTTELLNRCRLPPLAWARIDAALGPMLAHASDSILIGSTSALRAMVSRHGGGEEERRSGHAASADWWLQHGPDMRSAYELPFQLIHAGRRADLRRILLERPWSESLLLHRSETEVHGLWLEAQQGEPVDLAGEYREAHASWAGSNDAEHDGHFLMRLGGFISHATGGDAFTVSLLEHAVEEGRTTGCPEEELALRLNNLGHEQLLLGLVDPAIESFRESLDLRSRCLPEGHPHLLATIDNLGQAHHSAGRTEDALRYLRTAYKQRRRHLGDHDADTATSRNNLAMTLLAVNPTAASVDEAGQLLEAAYSNSLHVLGPSHPDTGISAGNLGYFHSRHGDMARARDLMDMALSVHRQTLGDDHEYVAIGQARLADLELQRGIRARDEGRLDEARAILTAELDARLVAHGVDSLRWASAARSLGELLAVEGDIPAAKALLEQVLDVRSRHLGPDHPQTQAVAARLAQLE